ncbi:methylmalonyl Co-A mutase-associated GTPase MeaB [Paracoccus tegillarcae]|uniref:Methylmalonyl Co-A mutase-associated GTPase MeaB n=1 Tax=Paracoccus tegillarcae TaxID=1529068 RepID=A0A2K9F054_9RHOB|nr:methylmalonyl Co-A mutase-associated GTPase MeaB [Paracoccus tegillarcae]AUH33732.1 methylmalonyl Co-A mutase-associated GTPase MeaB [Paracoccus tegillarcae]
MDELLTPLTQGSRRALSRAITLIESTRADHRERAVALLASLPDGHALRIGMSGTPGVGKSTFIETFGTMLTEQGLKVAVLAVDPSSTRSGGSILGDKTRMETLSRNPKAFIRPSPSRAELGGVARRTREAIRLCEAAGFDLILIETVGVGQSETLVAEMADLFVLLLAPAGGDELQGVKRGIMEMADIILVNKADGDLLPTARRTVADYAGALRLLRKRPQDPDGFPKALPVSAVAGTGLQEAWDDMQALTAWRREYGHFEATRARQAQHWFLAEVRTGLLARLETPEARDRLEQLGRDVAAGDTVPGAAAKQMLDWLKT